MGALQVQVYETYNSQHSYLVLELGGRSDLLENINAASGRRGWRRRRPADCPGSCSVPWPTATTWGSCTGEVPPSPPTHLHGGAHQSPGANPPTLLHCT